MSTLVELRQAVIEKLTKEVKGQTRIDLLMALKDLLYIVHEIQRKEWTGDEGRPN
jgi:hypothetical protein